MLRPGTSLTSEVDDISIWKSSLPKECQLTPTLSSDFSLTIVALPISPPTVIANKMPILAKNLSTSFAGRTKGKVAGNQEFIMIQKRTVPKSHRNETASKQASTARQSFESGSLLPISYHLP